MGLDALAQWIIERLWLIWPLRVVYQWQRGVLYHAGVPLYEFGPGVHWVTPFIEVLMVEGVTERQVDLVAQSITTKDKQTVTVSVNISFVIENLMKKQNEVFDFDDSLSAIAISHVGRKLSEWTWDEALERRSALERSLKETLTTRVSKWGVKIVEVGIPDYVLARQYRHFGIEGGIGL